MDDQELLHPSIPLEIPASLVSDLEDRPSSDLCCSIGNVEDGIDPDQTTLTKSTENCRQDCSDTAPFLLSHGVNLPEKALNSRITETAANDWLPLTLRLPYLTLMFSLSLALAMIVLAVTIYSTQNQGLGLDRRSPALFFGWRFLPTLIATIYALLVASMLNDVRRTEVFARLSKPGGASAADTICYTPGSWWKDPFEALRRTKNNGVRNWAWFFSAFTYIMVLLVVSPLSAGFLSPVFIQIERPASFSSPDISNTLQWPNISDLLMFRTISGALLNQSTSVWLSTDFAVLPFWPSDHLIAPLGPDLAAAFVPQQWVSETVVYKAELDCVPMFVVAKPEITDSIESDIYGAESFELSSLDGCKINVYANSPYLWNAGGGWWTGPPNYYSSLFDTSDGYSKNSSSNGTSDCGNRSMFWVQSGHPEISSVPFHAQAHLCSNNFFSANITVNVTINSSSTMLVFDTQDFLQERKPIDLAGWDFSQLQDAFLNPDWDTKFLRSTTDGSPMKFSGPLMAIAADRTYSPREIVNRTDLVRKAEMFHQQFFGESLLLAIESQPDWSRTSSLARVVISESRIVSNLGIGITLGVLFLLFSLFITIVAHHTSLNRRILNLSQDPGRIAVAAALIGNDGHTRSNFEGTSALSRETLMARLKDRKFFMDRGSLYVVEGTTEPDGQESAESGSSVEKSRDPRPAIFRSWVGGLLLLFLLALLAAIIVLYRMSLAHDLHQSPFVYQLNVNIMRTKTSLEPYSIIPTIFAIGVKLWFGAIGDTLKRLQPYLSMAKTPVAVSRSVLAEYANTPTSLVSVKAMKRHHWILALVGLGALATEAFTVGMSALWDREIRDWDHSVHVTKQLELRKVPIIAPFDSLLFTVPTKTQSNVTDQVRTNFLLDLYMKSFTNWLYGALVEVTQDASTPPWSKDTWSFVPSSSVGLINATSLYNDTKLDVAGHSRTITLETLAVRATLDCEPLHYPSDESLWLEKFEFSDMTTWNTTAIPHGLKYGYTLKGPANMGAGLEYLTCCANETNGTPGDAAIGYWSEFNYLTGEQGMTMTAKWIVGRPVNGTYQPKHNNSHPVWIWTERPRIAAISCTPLIEKANMSVVVELSSGAVKDYRLLGPPQNATEAWYDHYVLHNISSDTRGSDTTIFSQMNTTVSWGYVFWDALLTSGRARNIFFPTMPSSSTDPEDTSERAFNFRYPGLNVDFMSYSMLQLVNNSKEDLLDPVTLGNLANSTFGVFFKHFVSNNVNSTTGGNAYQPIGDKLPWSFGPAYNYTGQDAFTLQNNTSPTPRFGQAMLHIPVEQLIMSPIAVFLCLSLLVFLILTTIVMYSTNRDQYKRLPQDLDVLASTLALIHGSDKLLAWAQNAPPTKSWYRSLFSRDAKSKEGPMLARMGTFKTSDGGQRWGIELVDLPSAQGDEKTTSDDRVKLQVEEHQTREDNGDIGSHIGLLGTFEWEASSTIAAGSENMDRPSEDVERSSDGGWLDLEQHSEHMERTSMLR